ncbi:DUF6877 family protein [Paenibacillus alvei]|uniref:DUF6877 family protein n=1 Tax=Paenibacillus alvei TaxID=44250 RepID=UPI00227E9F78|nr:DUF6877 family protein [Paenibacillus alvei]MCY7484309.1 hypothetical protein [Paenibacillus alvei]
MTSPLHEIIMISHLLPAEVLSDINRRIGDWLAMGGQETDQYIEQQLRFARKFVQSGGAEDEGHNNHPALGNADRPGRKAF